MNLEPSPWRRRTQSSCSKTVVVALPAVPVWWLLVVCIALGGSLVDSQGLQAIPPRLYVKNLSKNVNLLCKSDKPIEDCSVKIPGYLDWSRADDASLPSGVGPYGDGWSRGECGVKLMTVKSANEGKFFCNVTVSGETFQQTIDITLTVTPQPTEIEIGRDTVISNGGYRENQTLTARCISEDGVPMSNLTWFLDDEPLEGSLLGEVQLRNRTDNRGKTLVTVEQELRYFLTAQDNGKRIVCKASHFAIAKNMMYRAFLPLNIHFAPLPTPTVDIRDSPHEQINVTIKANPRPTTSWTVRGQTIEEGQSNGPYQAYIPKDLGNGNYQVILRINDPTEQTELIELQATNGLGSRTYVIKGSRITENEIPDGEDDINEDGRSGAVFWLISIWTFCSAVIFNCLLR